MTSAPRIAPIPDAQEDARAAELLGMVNLRGVSSTTPTSVSASTGAAPSASTDAAPAANIFRTLVRHPGLFRRWLPFAGKLLAGTLSPRHRELAILRTGFLCQSDYEWGQHVAIAKAAGITDEEIARVVVGADAPEWTAVESALLRAVDELHAHARISDATWAVLAESFDTAQLIEVPMLIGHYHLVAFTLNSLGVEREPGVVGLPSV